MSQMREWMRLFEAYPNLVPGKMYRLARNMDDPELRGKAVVFKGFRDGRGGDVKRAIVSLVQDDGSLGEEWLVTVGSLIAL